MIHAESSIDQSRGSFLEHVNIVMFTYALDGALAFASGVLVAQALGPTGRGAYSLFIVSTAIAQMVLGLGFGNAAVYFINKGELALSEAVSAAHVIALAALAVTAAVVAAIVPWAGDSVLGDKISPWLLLAGVPVLIYASALRVLLQALSRFVAMGVVTLSQPLLMLVMVALDVTFGDPSPSRTVVFWILSNGASAVVALAFLGLRQIDARQIVRPRWFKLRQLGRFGVQGEAGNVLQLMNYRLDQYIIRGFVSLAGVGIYAVGVSMTEAVWLIANAVAIVLLPRLTAASDEDVRWMAPVAARNTLLIAACSALALAVVAPFLLPALFGSDYEGAVPALWLLLPGTVALTGSKVLTSYIFSRGRPLVNTGITLVSLAVTVIALPSLVPPFGVKGAAAASSIAYVAHFAAALYAYHRISGASVADVLLPRSSDARLYGDALRGIVDRIVRRPTAAVAGAVTPDRRNG